MLILSQLLNEGILISLGRVQTLLPGGALCVAIDVLAWLIDQAEVAGFGYASIEAIVIAILIGMAIRTVWIPSRTFRPGIVFTAQFVLEIAIVLLGASLELRSLEALGFALLAAVIITTAMTLDLGVGAGGSLGSAAIWRS